jgi:peptide-methionine (R)-S-oxide reductase
MNRRDFLLTSTSFAVGFSAARADTASFEITRSDAEWRAILTNAEYEVMRKEDTEPPFSSPLNDETRHGIYRCRGCYLPLYASETKYDSGTGWPSFHSSLPDAIGTREERRFIFQVRTEGHCRRCGSHLGHVFDDGPEPTSKRHCLNGVALVFRPT